MTAWRLVLAPVRLRRCGSEIRQLIQPLSVAPKGTQVSNRPTCLDVPGSSTADAQLQLWDCNGTGAQELAGASGRNLAEPLLEQVSGRGRLIGTADGTRLQIGECPGGSNQVWRFLTDHHG